MSAGTFSRGKTGEQKRIVYKEIRMKQRITNVHWLSQYRKSNPLIKIINLFTNITTNSRTSATIFLRQERFSADSSGHASLCPGALTAVNLARTTRSNQGNQSVLGPHREDLRLSLFLHFRLIVSLGELGESFLLNIG